MAAVRLAPPLAGAAFAFFESLPTIPTSRSRSRVSLAMPFFRFEMCEAVDVAAFRAGFFFAGPIPGIIAIALSSMVSSAIRISYR